MGKLAGLALSFIVLTILIIGLVFTAQKLMQSSQRVTDTQKNLEAAKENLAQAYAKLPWTMDHIIQDINDKVTSGQYDRATGEWLIQRIQDIRDDYLAP